MLTIEPGKYARGVSLRCVLVPAKIVRIPYVGHYRTEFGRDKRPRALRDPTSYDR